MDIVGTDQQVTAASISRIWRHFTPKALNIGIVFVSADRGDRAFHVNDRGKVLVDRPRNEKLNGQSRRRLEVVLKAMGHEHGYIRTRCGYQEEGMAAPAYEISYGIPGMTKQEAKKLAKKMGEGNEINALTPNEKLNPKHKKTLEGDFRQDSILWINQKVGAFEVYKNGTFKKVGAKFKSAPAKSTDKEKAKIGTYFTEWRKRRFTFASEEPRLTRLEYLPTSPSDWRQFSAEVRREK